jgi:hypothetical protein
MVAQLYSGTGDPNGAVFGNPGDVYQDETGVFWLKTTGPGTNTGWVAVAATQSSGRRRAAARSARRS